MQLMFLLNTGHSALEEADAVPEACSALLSDVSGG
jgi:hypothetical protein